MVIYFRIFWVVTTMFKSGKPSGPTLCRKAGERQQAALSFCPIAVSFVSLLVEIKLDLIYRLKLHASKYQR